MSAGARSLVASVLAVLAVLAVLVSGVSAVVVRSSEADEDPAPAPPSSGADVLVPPGKQVYSGDSSDATLLVPDSPAWTLRGPGEEVGFEADDDGVYVSRPAMYDANFCEDLPGVPRAFAGFTDPVPADEATPQETAPDVLGEWVSAARVADDGDRTDVSPRTLSPVRLDDGTAAWTSSSVVQNDPDDTSAEECSTAVEIRTLSALTGDTVTTVVLARGVDADGEDLPDGLGAEATDEILRSLDPL